MYHIINGLLKLKSLLPFSILYVLSDFTYLIVYYLIGYRKNVVRENLKRSFPGKTDRELLATEKKFYHHLCDLLFESMKMATISKEEMSRRMKILNYEPLLKHYDENKSVLLITSHYGNWEWTSSFSMYLPADKPMYQVYKQQKNKLFDRLIYNLRIRFGSVNVEVNELFDVLSSLKQQGKMGMIGLISDQSPSRKGIKYQSQFLNQRTPVITGTEIIAKKYDFPVYFVQIRRVKRGYYTCNPVPICLHPQESGKFEITEKYIRLLEQEIMAEPAYWLWSHRRWKFADK
ncbi:MAG TPA: lysophospholipid acyltransferase family protein [Paludibacteraceae bacterium]|jgi:KDO2-lipid IV(A) lauroyltransferase|nr:lysophospholipid acyltransferase family protein [Paludibacteraceae bacterium]HPS10043.1 lysophospholipid acyltransferase family protein [Paludibacteraceae bacterium]